ncbi:hypothetical protein MYX82_00825 [Acidobacteria bacterium AH-259-D05]|nr:hypothetical protein [Acidobacteria bacterium AH-259-D05]
MYLAAPFYISWQVTSVSLATALLLAWPFLLLGKVNYCLGKLNTCTANEMGAVIQETFSLAKVIFTVVYQSLIKQITEIRVPKLAAEQ